VIFHKSTYSDIQKYYPDNIVKFKETGDRLWRIIQIGHNEVRCQDADGFEIFLDLDEPYEVDYPLPGRVVYQNGPNACMLHRIPAKQYNRGIHSQNTALSVLTSGGSWQNTGFSIQKLQQFVDKPAYQDVSLISFGEDSYSSWALNRHISICRSGGIYALASLVGSFNWGEKTLSVNPLFKPDLIPLFPGWKFV